MGVVLTSTKRQPKLTSIPIGQVVGCWGGGGLLERRGSWKAALGLCDLRASPMPSLCLVCKSGRLWAQPGKQIPLRVGCGSV